jgi:hypothetical protein
VTDNLKDFSSDVLEPLGIEVPHPDAFLVAQIELAVARVARLQGHRGSHRGLPPCFAARALVFTW